MKPIAKMNFSANGVFYNIGDEVKVSTKEQLMKLNEKGFIEPLTMKDIQKFGKEEKPKIIEEKKEIKTKKEE